LTVLEPGRSDRAGGGDLRLAVEPGEVVHLELDPAPLEVADGPRDVAHPEPHLRVRAARPPPRGEQEEPGAAFGLVPQAGRRLGGVLQPELVRVERPSPGQVLARQGGVGGHVSKRHVGTSWCARRAGRRHGRYRTNRPNRKGSMSWPVAPRWARSAMTSPTT